MRDTEIRRHQMFERVKNFGADHANDFAPNGLGGQLFTDLGGIVSQLENYAAAEVSGVGTTREGPVTRAAAREALRDDLEAISRTARAMAEDTPGIDDQFRLPGANDDQALLKAARAFAVDASPLSAQFISHEVPADFLADLGIDIANMEAAISQQASWVGDQVAANAAIDETIDVGNAIVRKLDAIVRNRYANNPATLAEWTCVSHTERSPRRQAPTSATPPTPAPS